MKIPNQEIIVKNIEIIDNIDYISSDNFILVYMYIKSVSRVMVHTKGCDKYDIAPLHNS